MKVEDRFLEHSFAWTYVVRHSTKLANTVEKNVTADIKDLRAVALSALFKAYHMLACKGPTARLPQFGGRARFR